MPGATRNTYPRKMPASSDDDAIVEPPDTSSTGTASTGTATGALGACPGCGLRLPEADGPTHPYMTSSVACWDTYTYLLAAQYGDAGRMGLHQLVVDSYAVQHPGSTQDPRAVQSVGIHLMTLCLFLDHGTDPALGTTLHKRMVERPTFHPLPAPTTRGELTCADVPLSAPAEQIRRATFDWARSAWSAWSEHHATVHGWLTIAGLLPSTDAPRA